MKTILPLCKKFTLVKNPFFFGAIFSIISLFFFTAPVLAIDTQAISAHPTHATDTDPRSLSWFIYSIPAGDKKNDSVTIINHGTEPITLKVYPVDSTTASGGNFALAAENAPKHNVGTWVTMNTSEVTLAPKEQRDIPFTISIPTTATRGDYSGGIIFQETTPKKIMKRGIGINVISRVGVRIYETVPGAEQLQMNVRDMHYSVVDNYMTFTFTVENNGTVYTSPTGMLEIKDMFGRMIDNISLDSMLGIIVPGKPLTLTVPTKVLAPAIGWDTATAAIYYSPTKAAVAHLTFMPNPWSAFAVILVLLLIIALLVSKTYLVRYNAKTKKTTPAPHIFLIVGCILLGVIALSGLIAYLLNVFFGGK